MDRRVTNPLKNIIYYLANKVRLHFSYPRLLISHPRVAAS